jgi:hypothetical protein
MIHRPYRQVTFISQTRNYIHNSSYIILASPRFINFCKEMELIGRCFPDILTYMEILSERSYLAKTRNNVKTLHTNAPTYSLRNSASRKEKRRPFDACRMKKTSRTVSVLSRNTSRNWNKM